MLVAVSELGKSCALNSATIATAQVGESLDKQGTLLTMLKFDRTSTVNKEVGKLLLQRQNQTVIKGPLWQAFVEFSISPGRDDA